jgi:putative membrane protein
VTRAALGDLLALVNASLNGTSAVLIVAAYVAILRGRQRLHRALMLSAVGVSAAFLISYLTRVALTGTHRYPGDGTLKTIYLALLGSHMLLAAAVPPLVLRSVFLAWRRRFAEHRRIVRVTLPVWLYVSVTGVLVYVMLYHAPLGPHAR